MASAQEQIRMTRADSLARSVGVRERRQGRSVEQKSSFGIFANRLSLAVCCLVAFCAVWMVATKAATIFELNQNNVRLQDQIQQQQAVNASLKEQVDQLERPSRILNDALNKYHMQYKTPIMIPSTSTGQ